MEIIPSITSFTIKSSVLNNSIAVAVDNIKIAIANINPEIANLNDTVQWAGVGNKVTLDNSTNPNLLATVSDTENDLSNWDNGSLIIQRYVDTIATSLSNNIYNIIDDNNYTVSGSMLLKTNLAQDQFASFTNSNGVLTITFGADATSALISDVINHIQYQNDKPTGDTTIRFTLNDGSGGSTTADVKVESDTIYVTNSTDTATIDVSNGVSFSEAVAIASVDLTGNQTLVLDSTLNNSLTIFDVTLTENLTLDAHLLNEPTTMSTGTITNNANLTITNNASQTFEISSVIAGSGNITKSGSGATLGGSGTIGSEGKGAVTISEGGKLAPGNSPGKMTLNNGLTLNAGSTLEIQINNDTVNTGYDQVDVKGFVYLSNSILAITPNANLEIEKSFTIINNDGIDAVVGTFKDASEGALNNTRTGG